MVKVRKYLQQSLRQCFVRQILIAGIAVLLVTPAKGQAQRFYPDDPIWKVPPPVGLSEAAERKLSMYYDFFLHTFGKPGEHGGKQPIAAQAVNTLGEVPDSAWFTNRHGIRPMSLEELVRGPGSSSDPTAAFPWTVVGAKAEGITPGLTIQDAQGRRYVLKFDPLDAPEIASAADVIGSKVFYALGYNTPENYIVHFVRENLVVDPKARMVDNKGRERNIVERDVDRILERVPARADGRFRGLASLYIEGRPLGPFRYHGVRADDPNDTVPHEHRRDLRALRVFAAWLNHTDAKALNTHDTLVEDGGVKFIRHYLLDFGAILGSDSFEPKSPRAGNVYLLDWKASAAQLFTLGLYVPGWAFAEYPDIRGVGRFESEVFDPVRWKSNYYNPAFANCTSEDAFWAAKLIMSFSEPEIRALVSTGQFSDPRAVDYVTRTLVERQRKIGAAFLSGVLPLDNFRVRDGRLAWDDLGTKYGVRQEEPVTVEWARFDNAMKQRAQVAGSGPELPLELGEAEFAAVELRGRRTGMALAVFLRRSGNGWQAVGIERTETPLERPERGLVAHR